MIEDKDILNILIHEIKNPLTVIKGYSELIDDKKIGKIISKESDYINYLINNISVLNKLLNNIPFVICYEKINLNELFNSIISVYENKYNKINFENNIENNIVIESDINLISIALYNLIENACKYTQKGHVFISFFNDTIIIKDTGCGIKKENIPNLKNLYYRDNDKINGTGIGLFLVYKICDKLNLEINIISDTNKGCEVKLKIK